MASVNLGAPSSIEMTKVSSPVSPTRGMLPAVFSEAAHPGICVLHVVFKILAVFSYIFFYAWTKWFIGSFILTTIFLALDFWVTKNITGRILAGLRWWSFVKEDGTNEWTFEALTTEQQKLLNGNDKRIFWYGMYFHTGFWVLIAAMNLLTLHANNFVLCAIGATFSSSNLGGFRKCAKDSKSGMPDIGAGWMGLKAMRAMSKV